jgi:hypothetical protein
MSTCLDYTRSLALALLATKQAAVDVRQKPRHYGRADDRFSAPASEAAGKPGMAMDDGLRASRLIVQLPRFTVFVQPTRRNV